MHRIARLSVVVLLTACGGKTVSTPYGDPRGGGDDTAGGDTAAGDTTGGDTAAGDTTGGDTTGGDTAAGDTAGGDTTGDAAGGDAAGGDAAGGDAVGGDAVGGDPVVVPTYDTYVSPTGDDINNTGAMDSPWQTVNKGMQIAAGQVTSTQPAQVHVAAGTFAESITMVNGVSILGGYNDGVPTAWVRDIGNNETILRPSDDAGLLYAHGSGYTQPTVLDGVTVENGGSGASRTNVVIEEGAVTIQDSIIRLPTDGTDELAGLFVSGVNLATTLRLQRVRIEGGDVSSNTGIVYGMRIFAGGGGAAVNAGALAVDLPMASARRHRALDVRQSSLTMVNSSVLVAPVSNPTVIPIGSSEVIAVYAQGASLDLTNVTIDAGGGFHTMRGIEVRPTSTIALTDCTIDGGDATGPVDQTTSSHAVYLQTPSGGPSVLGSTLVVNGGTISGGTVDTGTTSAHRSFGLYAQANSTVTVTNASVNGGAGDWGIGIRFFDVASGTISSSRVNVGVAGSTCRNARECYGVFIERGVNPLAQQLSPQAPAYSCCDPKHFQVVIEGSHIVGGAAPRAHGIWAGGSPNPNMCINSSRIDAGTCSDGTSLPDCVGINAATQMPMFLHNNVVYGGTSNNSYGLRVVAGTPSPGTRFESTIANNYFHGGNATPGGTSVSFTRGLFIGDNTGTGSDTMRFQNNIFDSGTGQERYAVQEEGNASDPFRFHYNNVIANSSGTPTKALLYLNCEPGCCGAACGTSQELTTVGEVDTMLTTNGQATTTQGDCLSDAACLVDADPRVGDWHQASASNCVDAGIERNGSCNICQTPWVDRYGSHRLDWENRLTGGTCPVVDCSISPTPAGCVAMRGDDIPDIGPAEL